MDGLVSTPHLPAYMFISAHWQPTAGESTLLQRRHPPTSSTSTQRTLNRTQRLADEYVCTRRLPSHLATNRTSVTARPTPTNASLSPALDPGVSTTVKIAATNTTARGESATTTTSRRTSTTPTTVLMTTTITAMTTHVSTTTECNTTPRVRRVAKAMSENTVTTRTRVVARPLSYRG